jgi:copper(I)-binding protein
MLKKIIGVALLAVAANAWAEGKDIIVEKAWVGETVPGETKASVHLNLTSTKTVKVLDISSPAAKSVEMQRLYPSGGKIKTIVVKNLKLQRGKTVVFGERMISLMLIDLTQPLKAGERVPLTLTLLVDGQKSTVDTKIEVRPVELGYKGYSEPKVNPRQ